jgi:hypothetical protein
MSWVITASPRLKVFDPLRRHFDGGHFVALIQGDKLLAAQPGTVNESNVTQFWTPPDDETGEDAIVRELTLQTEDWAYVREVGSPEAKLKALEALDPVWGPERRFRYNDEMTQWEEVR